MSALFNPLQVEKRSRISCRVKMILGNRLVTLGFFALGLVACQNGVCHAGGTTDTGNAVVVGGVLALDGLKPSGVLAESCSRDHLFLHLEVTGMKKESLV